MAFFKKKESGPRLIQCPNCGARQEVSASAQSVVCRSCNTTVKVTDQKISAYSATVSLETSGSVTIEKKGALVVQKRVVASNLMLMGSLKGNSVIYDCAHIAAGAQLIGELKARSLEVEEGAALKGFLQIGGDVAKTETPRSSAAVRE
ncbi:MAG TPA: polymer-forming cytoskeletal protein [Planctomycetota bacterium]|jgi:hypothetical protein